jgi:diguanylate cyclase (GGDEF)-like protein
VKTDKVLNSWQNFANVNSGKLLPEVSFREQFVQLLEALNQFGLAIRVRVLDRAGAELASYGDIATHPFSRIDDAFGHIKYGIEAADHREISQFDATLVRKLFDEVRPVLIEILKLYWATRDSRTGLYRDTEGTNLQRLNSTLSEWLQSQTLLAVLHLDLDDFKKNVNTKFGEPVGDKVLSEFGMRIRQHFGEKGIPIRKGGEEFSVFLPCANFQDALKLAQRFRRFMASEPFEALSKANSCSIGICLFPHHYPNERKSSEDPFAFLIKPAMEAEERAKKELGKNCFSLPPTIQAEPDQHLAWPSALRLAVISARTGWFSRDHLLQNDFNRSIAEILSDAVQESTLSSIADSIAEVKRECGIEVRLDAPSKLWLPTIAAPFVHPLVWATIVLFGLLKAGFEDKGPLESGDRLFLQASSVPGLGSKLTLRLARGTSVLSLVELEIPSTEDDVEIEVGPVWIDSASSRDGVKRARLENLSPVLLVTIGALDLPDFFESALAGRVEVDDRPVTGGGLPDFWQSNLSRLVHLTSTNSNVAYIVVAGDTSKAEKTVEYLGNVKSWESAEMFQRLGLDLALIDTFKSRHVEIRFSNTDSESLVRELYQAYVSDRSAGSVPRPVTRIATRLPIRIQQQSLTPRDGLRCSTAAEAYPRIVSELRSMREPKNRDHLNREFVELVSFKLVLDNPTVERVPDYWLRDSAQLQHYYEKQFGSSGLFGKKLYRWGSSQSKDQVSFATEEIVTSVKTRNPTRRIILFVSEPEDDLKNPLGLVCVHILPRFAEGRWNISFNWVWRTVEALVGLPFSLYGSIEFSTELLSKINAELSSSVSIQASMGRLTYLALSLHLFTGEGDENIARTILAGAV